MTKSMVLKGVATLLILGLIGFAGWIYTLPSAVASPEAPPVPQEEVEALLSALTPKNTDRPTIAVIGINDATETTDYLMPTGILRRADVADVVLLSTAKEPVQLYPALKVEPDATIAEFDAGNPGGADFVIVPAMSRDDDPAVMAWLQSQAQKGATIIGVCAGAKVVAAAGLLKDHRATTHWWYLSKFLKIDPSIDYVRDRRMVADDRVVTTTGISASMPVALMLIEAIAGRAKAEEVAQGLGIQHWGAEHASDAFRLTRGFATTVLGNVMAFWRRDTWQIEVERGVDEVSLALVTDAWSRTYRSGVQTFNPSETMIETTNGIRILPDINGNPDGKLASWGNLPPADVLDETLVKIGQVYGERTAAIVAMQLEYPRQ